MLSLGVASGSSLRSERPQVRLLPGAPYGFVFVFAQWAGPLAQLAEQLTLNQRVHGSSP
jgi:hypothetical protein